mmetsp:Transcript_121609/g.190802  ORF Transcript_121609/g.190802 Transcript_121609/m.190802 type:complete len:163 (-) Transcript_121609:159-647(-)
MGKKPKRTNKPSPLDRMKEAFAIVDIDLNSEVSREEFSKAMEAIGLDQGTANSLFNRFNPDGNDILDKEEFFAYCASGGGEIRSLLLKSTNSAVEKIVEVFQAWDTDGDGTISRDELEKVLILLNPSFTKKDMNTIMKAADKNGDGLIDYEEFANWLAGGKK